MKLNALIGLFIVLNLTACGGMKNYFPDKEKDYQLTTEIPELKIPADLTDNTIQKAVVIESPHTENKETEDVAAESSDSKATIQVDLVEYSDGATKIRIEDGMERSWRTVGKALSTHSIEITDRNELERVYYVQYDADFKEIEDGSIWDEVLFIFGADPANEEAFKIRLAGNNQLTEVIVLDADDQPLSKGAGLKLLKLLYKTIKDDLVDTQ